MNFIAFVPAPVISVVLIDTWWNVNMTPTAVCAIVLIVLIDTWWNVNEPLI